jgi:hypothetical protein
MGKGEGGIDASRRGGENDGLGFRKAHHVSVSPEEDRGGAAGAAGEGQGGEEEGDIATGYQENVCLR